MSSIAPIASPVAVGTVGGGSGMDAPGAVAQQSFQDALHRSVMEVQVTPDDLAGQFGSRVMERIETVYDRLQKLSGPGLDTGATEPATPGGAEGAAPAADSAQPANQTHAPMSETKQALQLLEHAFSFAIEATLVSKVSTESTRIFNTFLKGS